MICRSCKRKCRKRNTGRCHVCDMAAGKAGRMEDINSAQPKISNEPIGTPTTSEVPGRDWKA